MDCRHKEGKTRTGGFRTVRLAKTRVAQGPGRRASPAVCEIQGPDIQRFGALGAEGEGEFEVGPEDARAIRWSFLRRLPPGWEQGNFF